MKKDPYDVELLKALACETRKKVLLVLMESVCPLTVSSISESAGISMTSLSDILQIFFRVGIVARKRRGRCILYVISDTFEVRVNAFAKFFEHA